MKGQKPQITSETVEPESTNPDPFDTKRALRLGGSFVFGVLEYASLNAIPRLFAPDVIEYIPFVLASLVLFTVFIVLVVAFLYLSGVAPEGFLVLGSAGGFIAFLVDMGYYGPSPVIPLVFFGYLVVLAVGTAIFIGSSRSTRVNSLLNRSS